MGYCCVAYSVDFSTFKKLRGCRDEKLLARVIELADERKFVDDDDEFEGDDDAVAGDDGDPELAAIDRILNGQPFDPATPEFNEFAVGHLSNLCTVPCDEAAFELKAIRKKIREAEREHWRSSYEERAAVTKRLWQDWLAAFMNDLEQALARHGLEQFPLRALFSNGNPLGPVSQFNAEGYLRPAEVKQFAPTFKPSQWSDLTKEVKDALVGIERALAEAARRGIGLTAAISSLLHFFQAWPFDVDRLEAMRGSKSAAVRERAIFAWRHYQDYTRELNELSDEEFIAWKRANWTNADDDEAPAHLTGVPRAAWEILFRKRLEPDDGHLYVTALELICVALGGRMLDNAAVAPADIAHFDAVDEALESAGLARAVSMQQLVFGGPPIKIPRAEDWPATGHLSPAAVKKARGLIAKHDWSTAPDNVQETLKLVNDWLEIAATQDAGVVCFYS